MSNIFSINWWISMIVECFIIMCFFYLLKWVNSKVNVPVVGDIINAA